MSVATKKGDRGQTRLRFGQTVAKSHPRIEALGSVDELMAALGLARAWAAGAELQSRLIDIQHDLIRVMGELAIAPKDRSALAASERVGPELTAQLDGWIVDLEARRPPAQDWVLPGATVPGAALDLARTACRRAERRVVFLKKQRQLPNREILVYLNRLGDVLWLLAQETETFPPARGKRKSNSTV